MAGTAHDAVGSIFALTGSGRMRPGLHLKQHTRNAGGSVNLIYGHFISP